jgi:hypothetical protein
VELDFELGGHRYRVLRGLTNAELYLDGAQTPIANSITGVTELLQRRLGMTQREFFNTYFTGQKELAVLAAMQPVERAKFLSQVLGYERLKGAQDLVRGERARIVAEVAGLRAGMPDAEVVTRQLAEAESQLAAAAKRQMDCVDCHNRPTHIYLSPDEAVNNSLAAGRLDASLPYLKRQSVELLSKPYRTNDEALESIAAGLADFYRANYPDVYAAKDGSISGAVAELRRIYQTYFFPEMKTDWKSHPNNIGHYYFQGCFRCHDGKHQSRDGRVIRNDCNVCHTTLDQTENGVTTTSQNGAFRHPAELGKLSELSCTACHSGKKEFKHPVNLGDISQFKCADCHSGKVWAK